MFSWKPLWASQITTIIDFATWNSWMFWFLSRSRFFLAIKLLEHKLVPRYFRTQSICSSTAWLDVKWTQGFPGPGTRSIIYIEAHGQWQLSNSLVHRSDCGDSSCRSLAGPCNLLFLLAHGPMLTQGPMLRSSWCSFLEAHTSKSLPLQPSQLLQVSTQKCVHFMLLLGELRGREEARHAKDSNTGLTDRAEV